MKLAPTLPPLFEQLRKSPGNSGLLLGAFALGSTLILSVADDVTGPVIAQRYAEDLNASLAQVVPAGVGAEGLANSTLTLADPIEGEVLVYRAFAEDALGAVAFELTGYGYSGAIRVLIGIDPTGQILGVRVLSHTETPGLGDGIEHAKSNWIEGFNGRSLSDPAPEQWRIEPDGGIFDSFSGASITPRAVVSIVHRGLELFDRQRATLVAKGTAP